MNDRNNFVISLTPALFAIIALVLFVLTMFDTSSNTLLSIGCISMGISYLSSFYIKKYLKESSNFLNLIFGFVILVLGIIILILDIVL